MGGTGVATLVRSNVLCGPEGKSVCMFKQAAASCLPEAVSVNIMLLLHLCQHGVWLVARSVCDA